MASKVIHDQEHRGNLIGIYDYYQPKKSCIGLMLFFVTGLVHAQLVAQDDSFGIPFGQPLHALGILKNDTLKGETDFGGTAELVTGVTNGTLTCPDVTPGLCADGSFQYIPGSGFSGFSGFRLYAATRFDMPLLTHKRPPAPKTIPNNQKKFLSRVFCATFSCLALIGFSNDASSWGGSGHTAIGILAVNQLQPDALLVLEGIVNPLTPQAISDACNWPDVIRETEEGQWSGPLHYINIPRGDALYLASRDCPEHPEYKNSAERPAQHCATEAIKYFAAGLTRPQASREQRWQAFSWLCHLVADLHQPMHAGFADDRGGNNVEVIFKEEPMNLHHFWDTALINQQAGSWQYLVGQLSLFPPATAASDWSPAMVNDWTNESHSLAKENAYPATEDIDEIFAQQSWELTQQQIRTAAAHLALIINSELKPVIHVDPVE